MIRLDWNLLTLAVLLLLVACTGDRHAGGNSSETPNTLALQIKGISPGQGLAFISILPEEWVEGFSKESSLVVGDTLLFNRVQGSPDERGNLTVRLIEGSYRVYARLNEGLGASAVVSVYNDSGVTLSLDLDSLRQVRASVPASAKTLTLQGTDMVIPVGDTGIVMLWAPKGNWTLLALADTGVLYQASMNIKDSNSTTVDSNWIPAFADVHSEWKWSSLASIDLSALQAESFRPFLFPLLLRLDSTRIPVSQVRADGLDLLILDAMGERLPSRIQNWSASGGNVYVLVPIVEGASTLEFTLLWGNPDTTLLQSEIWTTDDQWNTVLTFENSFADQSESSHSTLSPELLSHNFVPGVVGNGYKPVSYDSSRIWIDAKVSTAQSLVFEAWCKPEAGGDWRNLIADRNYAERLAFGRMGDSSLVVHVSLDSTASTSGQDLYDNPMSLNQWHLATVEFDHLQKTIRVWVDGTLRKDEVLSDEAILGTTDTLLFAGSYGSGIPVFSGVLDEMRVMTRNTQGAEVKLRYLAEQPASKIVQFKPPRPR